MEREIPRELVRTPLQEVRDKIEDLQQQVRDLEANLRSRREASLDEEFKASVEGRVAALENQADEWRDVLRRREG